MLQKRNEKQPKHKRFGIVINPIEALVDDQVDECSRLGINAVSLTERELAKHPGLIGDICNAVYDLGIILYCSSNMYANFTLIAVYVSPEKLMQRNSPFQKYLKAQTMKGMKVQDRVAFMVTDECHLVENW